MTLVHLRVRYRANRHVRHHGQARLCQAGGDTEIAELLPRCRAERRRCGLHDAIVANPPHRVNDYGLQVLPICGYAAWAMANSPQMADIGLGSRIRLARTTARMTITGLAERIGVSRDSLSDYENEKTDPPASVIRKIAEELDTSADWLLFGDTRRKFDGKPRKPFAPVLEMIKGDGERPPDWAPETVALDL
jgi:transcriptional regulator with XRE-family HTH domain